MGFTRKKIDKRAIERYSEYNIVLRDEFLAHISIFAKEDLFFVDESGVHLLLLYRYVLNHLFFQYLILYKIISFQDVWIH